MLLSSNFDSRLCTANAISLCQLAHQEHSASTPYRAAYALQTGTYVIPGRALTACSAEHHSSKRRSSRQQVRSHCAAPYADMTTFTQDCTVSTACTIPTGTLGSSSSSLRSAGPAEEPPSYDPIDSQPLNRLIMSRFRSQMAAALREDVPSQGYACRASHTTTHLLPDKTLSFASAYTDWTFPSKIRAHSACQKAVKPPAAAPARSTPMQGGGSCNMMPAIWPAGIKEL